MKQLLQNLSNGKTTIADVPRPGVEEGHLLICTANSLVSAGTERTLVEFGKSNLIGKARQQPEKVRMVLDKLKTDGLGATLDAVRSKLNQPMALGYCNVGTVLEVGAGVEGFAIGDLVVSNGQHAEVVSVPQNLCALVPDDVSAETSAFTVLGAIGLQGIRLAQPTLGETFVVTGLGLIGLMTVQLLRAQGCRVLGIDMDPARLELARGFGAKTVNLADGEDALAAAKAFSRGRGVDGVIITASTKSNEPVSQAAKMCRKRGRIVLVGVTGLELSRADFYEKELSFQVSCSYGPGRYDPAYEEGGQDYPVGFVRWTEQRNFEAVLDLMASGALDVSPLISHRFPLEQAEQAYATLLGKEPVLGILLEYPGLAEDAVDRKIVLSSDPVAVGAGRVSVIGAGNYAGRVLVPALKEAGAILDTIVSAGGSNAAHQGRKHGFANASSDADAAIDDASVDSVVVATRHDSHAGYVLKALRAGKHVFCEKPLCLSLDDLDEIEQEIASRPDQLLMLGFNRRFAPLTVKIKELLSATDEPKSLVMTVNAGTIPDNHWTQDVSIGGGRLVGEGCHFIDLMRHLVGADIRDWQAVSLGRGPDGARTDDRSTVTLQFEDGSVGTLHYLANGHRSFPKERLEIFCAGRVLQLDNFRKLRTWGWPGLSGSKSWGQDKGQKQCVKAFIEAVRQGGKPPIPVAEIMEVSRVSIEVQKALV